MEFPNMEEMVEGLNVRYNLIPPSQEEQSTDMEMYSMMLLEILKTVTRIEVKVDEEEAEIKREGLTKVDGISSGGVATGGGGGGLDALLLENGDPFTL